MLVKDGLHPCLLKGLKWFFKKILLVYGQNKHRDHLTVWNRGFTAYVTDVSGDAII